MKGNQLRQMLDVGVAVTAERDREALLTYILDTAISIAGCDGGTLYLLEEDGLHFCRMVTQSQGVRQGGHDGPITLAPVPLNPSHVCARAVLENRVVNVSNVQTDKCFDFAGAKRYDAMTGYCTKSMLVLPLADDKGNLIGVLQLINALDEQGAPAAFSQEIEPLMIALASQAAISLTNMQYAEQIHKLLDSLVGALSTAIDQRTPYNANHTRNMAKYAARFLDWLEKTKNPWQFDAERRRAFLMSVWLHDVGKLVVPLAVMDKDSRLGPMETDVENRFDTMVLLDRIAVLEGRMTAGEEQARARQREEALELIRRVNRVGFLEDEALAAIDELAGRTYETLEGENRTWLTPEEHAALSVRRGTLTAQERAVMESHAVMTTRILEQVSFPREYAQVPQWAGAHHELLNGRGYPDHLTGDKLPPEVRLLTVLDIFDALTALDRPYKPGMPVGKAFAVLEDMAAGGALDGGIVALFRSSGAWEEEEREV